MFKLCFSIAESGTCSDAKWKVIDHNWFSKIEISSLARGLSKAQQEITAQGNSASIYSVDVADAQAVENCIQDIVAQHKRIDILFNNAGIFEPGTIETSIEHIEKVININLLGAMYVAKFVALQMKKQRSGYIFNVSSMSGKRAFPRYGVYAASKFGLVGYGEALLKELVAYGVKVTNLLPQFCCN